MRILNPSLFAWNLVIALTVSVGLGIAAHFATPWGWWPGLLALMISVWMTLRKPLRRLQIARGGIPDSVRKWIEASIPMYRGLDTEGRERFERDVAFVLEEWNFEGVGDAEVTEERRAAVASGVAILLHGHPDWEMPSRHTALFYPQRFDDDYLTGHRGDLDGMAHSQGPVILAVDALDADWADPHDGHNVVLHELAHLLDFKDSFMGEMPEPFQSPEVPDADDLVEREMRRIRNGQSILRRYGATNRAEFFAVAVESFFERPHMLASRHRDLYAALVEFFGYDPREFISGNEGFLL